ncbi:ribose 5-phosphate isomerase A [Acidilobus sp.]|uniref:ribose 5-phosphate isomerase A n=1 Tax=Acidilobus sp. TaxID=1872109 RepID=UPI003CFFD99F
MSCNPKEAAAAGAVEVAKEFIAHASLVGIGTGTTVKEFLMRASGLLRGKRVVSSSLSTALSLSGEGVDVIYYPAGDALIDVYIDGADEVTLSGDMIKGRGGALLGEKMLTFFSRISIFIVGEDKLVEKLGSRGPLPLEVVPEAYPMVASELRSMGFKVVPREGSGKVGPLISDWRGMIVDVYTGPIEDPGSLDMKLHNIPGVVDTGLFLGMADYVVVGRRDCRYEVLRVTRKTKASALRR